MKILLKKFKDFFTKTFLKKIIIKENVVRKLKNKLFKKKFKESSIKKFYKKSFMRKIYKKNLPDDFKDITSNSKLFFENSI